MWTPLSHCLLSNPGCFFSSTFNSRHGTWSNDMLQCMSLNKYTRPFGRGAARGVSHGEAISRLAASVGLAS